jgi:thiosulfate/3-mercaptopyruvate sulfurtransferase
MSYKLSRRQIISQSTDRIVMYSSILITPQELAAMQAASKPLVLIDTREEKDYAAQHIPGAINLRQIFTNLLDSSTAQVLKKLQTDFSELFGAVGLSGEETAVIYEDAMHGGYGQSCRGYFLLKYLGYPKVLILHGGYLAWKMANFPIDTSVPKPQKKSFPLKINSSILVTKEQMLESLNDPNIIKLDVRDRDEWMGLSSSPYGVDFCPRKGRIPGAVWIEWYKMMEANSLIPKFRSKTEILSICEEIGIKPEQIIYLYCFKGSRAANTMVALQEAGFIDVTLA